MIELGRTDRSVVGRWWWTVDRWTLAVCLLTMAVGVVLIMAASPAVADRIGLQSFHFVWRQILFLGPALLVLFGMSLLPVVWVRRIAVVGFLMSLILLVGTLLGGESIKGARRWIDFGGFLLQPSEFAKPTFAVFAAWMLSHRVTQPGFPGYLLASVAAMILLGLLLLQPDVGMTLVVATVWITQMFLAGIPMAAVAVIALVGAAGAVGAYALFPHVASRIDRFLDPSSGDTFQIDASLNAFGNGGLFGTNMGVNVRLLPAKGMTLPFISYGGSSLLALAIGMGFVLALTRRRPGVVTTNSDAGFMPRGAAPTVASQGGAA